MKEFLYNGKSIKLSKMLNIYMPELGYSYFQKLLRKGEIKLNGKKINKDILINDNDAIKVYAKDELLKKYEPEIIYDDKNISVIYKPYGMQSKGRNSFEEIVKNEVNKDLILCHRIDTNTSGLLIFAKNKIVFEEIKNAFKNHNIEKTYYALVYGQLQKKQTLTAYLKKDKEKGKVSISDKPLNDKYKKIITEINPIKIFDEYTLLEIKLITGKTHQIRAHLAYLGFPVIGDSKYGKEFINRKFGKKKQLLIAYKLIFNTEEGKLSYLNGKQIKLPQTIERYFDII